MCMIAQNCKVFIAIYFAVIHYTFISLCSE